MVKKLERGMVVRISEDAPQSDYWVNGMMDYLIGKGFVIDCIGNNGASDYFTIPNANPEAFVDKWWIYPEMVDEISHTVDAPTDSLW